MTKGLLRYIKEPLLADAVPPPTSLQLDKRTQAFGFILLHLSFSERQAIEPILALNTQDAYTLWLNIKERHERVTISRVWASWKRLNAAPGDHAVGPSRHRRLVHRHHRGLQRVQSQRPASWTSIRPV